MLTAILMLFFVVQFLPFFHYANGQSISLANYVWNPTINPAVTDFIVSAVPGFTINSIALYGAAMPLIAVVIVVLLWVSSGNLFVVGLAGVWGIWNAIGFMSSAALGLGGPVFYVMIALLLAAVVASVICFLPKIIPLVLPAKKVQDTEVGYCVAEVNA